MAIINIIVIILLSTVLIDLISVGVNLLYNRSLPAKSFGAVTLKSRGYRRLRGVHLPLAEIWQNRGSAPFE
jgi:predicted small integral membrane protein